MISMIYGGVRSHKNNSSKGFERESYYTFNGIHIMLLINSVISLAFSILYFSGISDFDDYFIIPIVIRQCFYFSINYYCICLSEEEDNHELFLSGKILVTIYIIIWNFIYKFIKNSIKNERFLYIFQMSLSSFIILVFIYYLFFSNAFKYIICANCLNCDLCCCRNCCSCWKYSIYCDEGTLISDCCCCDDENNCCYNNYCDNHCYECNCCDCCKIPENEEDKDDKQ